MGNDELNNKAKDEVTIAKIQDGIVIDHIRRARAFGFSTGWVWTSLRIR